MKKEPFCYIQIIIRFFSLHCSCRWYHVWIVKKTIYTIKESALTIAWWNLGCSCHSADGTTYHITTPEGLIETTNSVVSFSVGMVFSMNTSYTWERECYSYYFTIMWIKNGKQNNNAYIRTLLEKEKWLHHIAESLGASCTSYQTHKHSTYLIAARCVVEHLQRCLIAVRHICSSAEEHQSTCFIRQRTPEHLYAIALLRKMRETERSS